MTDSKLSLIDRLQSAPRAADPERAEGFRDDLSEALAEAGCGDLAGRLDAKPLAAFIDGVTDGSPYLREIMLREPALLADTLLAAPQERLDALLEQGAADCRDAEDMAAAMVALRRLKEAAALLVALCDLGGVWSVEEVTGGLSRIAGTALSASVDFLLRRAADAGKFIPADPKSPSVGSGLVILGMGKLGAGELNFSSDIDIIVFYEDEAGRLAEDVEPGTFFTRLVRDLVKLMQERTRDGYVFRTDLRLRPDPGATAPAISVGAALQYYESLAQNWERAAMIKARPVAGDIEAGGRFLKEISPFVWRKYMDFAALADVHAMKRQIHAHKGHGEIAVAGHNIKLGRGGIREIEFFVQTQQLIAGGRNPDLRVRATLDALARLQDAGWLTAETRDDEAAAYRYLRRIEHRLQMVADDQTHELPEDAEALEEFASFCGYDTAAAFSAELVAHMERVRHHYGQLFEGAPELSGVSGSLVFTGDDDDPETLQTIEGMGYSGARSISEAVRAWHYGRFPATRSAKAREALTELTPALLTALGHTTSPDSAFAAFDRFVRGLPAGVQLFAMLRSNPELLDLIATIMGTAPRLADLVAVRPHILDAMLEPGFFNRLPDEAEIAEGCDRVLGQARDYEDYLDRIRIYGQEQSFLIGVRILSGNLGAEEAGIAYAALADILIGRLAERVLGEIEKQHGKLKGAEYAVLAMGRLGSREMTAASDLDLIVLYDHDPKVDASSGKRAISPNQYFIRFTQRFVAALSAPTAEGSLYEVDMRLRPSGRSGPVATHIDSFTAYQREEAWTWEHMALTRARVVAGSKRLAGRVDEIRREVIGAKRKTAELAGDVASMRRRIDRDKAAGDRWDIKSQPGGLTDIEFVAQFVQLRDHVDIGEATTAERLRAFVTDKRIPAAAGSALLSAHSYYQNLMQLLRLCIAGPFDPAACPAGLGRLIAESVGEPDLARVEAGLDDRQAEVRKLFEKLVAPVPQAG
ncbi:MAG: bifunctional [glutamine synthetase] adenylyltransferase/[glutamine synthetase]-adenylyl-L-tyrosine phosphorylase [Flavobacteriaceae bacterium]